MSLHWRMLSTAEKIEAVKTAWHPGISASRIAAHFYGATRNAVIGLYSRYPSDLSGTPLKKPTKAVVAMVEAKTKRTIRCAFRALCALISMSQHRFRNPPSKRWIGMSAANHWRCSGAGNASFR